MNTAPVYPLLPSEQWPGNVACYVHDLQVLTPGAEVKLRSMVGHSRLLLEMTLPGKFTLPNPGAYKCQWGMMIAHTHDAHSVHVELEITSLLP